MLNARHKGIPVNNKDSVNKIKQLNEWHLKMFIDYFDYFDEQQKLKSFIQNRKSILDFILQKNINNKQFNEITQKDIENYAEKIINKVKEKNLAKDYLWNNALYPLDNYLSYFEAELSFKPDYSKYGRPERNHKNHREPLTSKEVEAIRYVIKDNKYLKFMFEFALECGIRFEDMNYYSSSTFLPDENCFLSPDGSKLILSQHLRNIINEIIDLEEFINPVYKRGTTLKRFRELLVENNISRSNIESRDVNSAYEKKLSFKCPECGREYEATAENWIIKQYCQGGNLWIVCKEVCGKNDI